MTFVKVCVAIKHLYVFLLELVEIAKEITCSGTIKEINADFHNKIRESKTEIIE